MKGDLLEQDLLLEILIYLGIEVFQLSDIDILGEVEEHRVGMVLLCESPAGRWRRGSDSWRLCPRR